MNKAGEKSYAGRMPYYGGVYYVFHLFLDKTQSLDALVLFQILFESLAMLLMAVLAYQYTQNRLAFWGCYLALLFSMGQYLAYRESFDKFCMFFVYSYHAFLRKGRQDWDLFKASTSLSLVCLLKPALLLFFLPVGLLRCWVGKR